MIKWALDKVIWHPDFPEFSIEDGEGKKGLYAVIGKYEDEIEQHTSDMFAFHVTSTFHEKYAVPEEMEELLYLLLPHNRSFARTKAIDPSVFTNRFNLLAEENNFPLWDINNE